MLSTDQAAILAYLMRQPSRTAAAAQIASDLQIPVRDRVIAKINDRLRLSRIVGNNGLGYRLELANEICDPR